MNTNPWFSIHLNTTAGGKSDTQSRPEAGAPVHREGWGEGRFQSHGSCLMFFPFNHSAVTFRQADLEALAIVTRGLEVKPIFIALPERSEERRVGKECA